MANRSQLDTLRSEDTTPQPQVSPNILPTLIRRASSTHYADDLNILRQSQPSRKVSISGPISPNESSWKASQRLKRAEEQGKIQGDKEDDLDPISSFAHPASPGTGAPTTFGNYPKTPQEYHHFIQQGYFAPAEGHSSQHPILDAISCNPPSAAGHNEKNTSISPLTESLEQTALSPQTSPKCLCHHPNRESLSTVSFSSTPVIVRKGSHVYSLPATTGSNPMSNYDNYKREMHQSFMSDKN